MSLPLTIKATEAVPTTGSCNDDLITIESVVMEQKDDSVAELSNATIEGKTIKLNLKMNTVDSTIKYKMVIKNDGTEDYSFPSNINGNSDYITYTYSSDEAGNIVKAGTSKTLYLTVKYANQVPATAFNNGSFNDNKDLVINLSTGDTNPNTNTNTNTNTNNNVNIKNPETGTEATVLFIIVTLFAAGLCYIIFNKSKSIKHLVIILGLTTIILPLTVYAVCTCDINIESKVTIEEPPVVPSEPDNPIEVMKANVVTSGQGLYNEGGNRYVFKGANPNNNITINSNNYRIISIEADNSLKLIRTSGINIMFDPGYYEAVADVTEANSLIGVRGGNGGSNDFCYNTSPDRYLGCKVWGSSDSTYKNENNELTKASQFPKGSVNRNLPNTDSYINTYLNTTWFSDQESGIKSLIENHRFNIGPIDVDMNQEDNYLWIGRVGLINTSDYVKASSNTTCTGIESYVNTPECYNNSNTHNYLYTSGVHEWTMNPTGTSNNSRVWSINTDGSLDASSNARETYLARPVFFVRLMGNSISGDGSTNNPYNYMTQQ